MKNKLCTLFLALVASVGTIYADAVKISDLYYNLNVENRTAEVTSSRDEKYSGEIVIPEDVTYMDVPYDVTAIGTQAFYACTSLMSVIIPNSVTLIGEGAFYKSTSMTSVTIGNSVSFIDQTAFQQCNGLVSITIAEDNPYYCSVDGVLFNKDKTTLMKYPAASVLSSYTIPESVTSIGDMAFNRCANLIFVAIPDNVTYIGVGAFSNSSGLTRIAIPENVSYIGWSAFAGCTGLSSLTCEAVTPPVLGTDALVFTDVEKSIPVYVPAGSIEAYKDSIGWKDFTNIQAIPGTDAITVAQAIAIGQALGNGGQTTEEYEIIGYVIGVREAYDQDHKTHSVWMIDALDNANSGEALYLNRGSVDKELKIGNKISIKAKISNYKGDIETLRGNVTILDDTERIPSIVSGVCGAVGDRTNLTWLLNTSTGYLEIKGSGAMINFSTYSFSWRTSPYVSSVRKVILPTELTRIGTAAFAGCVNLDSIVIPEKVDSIWGGAFNSCVSLTHINIPESVKAIGYGAFDGCTGLTEPLHNSRLFVYMPKSYEGKYIVPDGIASVISMSFAQCANITEIVMPASLKRLGYSVFEGCTTLQSLTCYAVNPPECRIDEVVCENNSFCGLDMTIPLYVPAESIDAYKDSLGWKDFTNIQAIQPAVPTEGTCGENLRWAYDKPSHTLTITGSGAMYDFAEATNVPWASYVADITVISLPKGLTTIGVNAFRDCSSVTKIHIPQVLTASGSDSFYGCTGLQEVHIDDLVAWSDVRFGNDYSNPLYYGQLYMEQEKPVTILPVPAGVTDLGPVIGGNTYSAVEVEDLAAWCSSVTVPADFHPQEIYYNGQLVRHLVIPEGVTTVRERCFELATCLLSVTFPTTMKTIGTSAFAGCVNIEALTVNAIEPPVIDTMTFAEVKRDVAMSVPCGSVDAYMAAPWWREFTNYPSAKDMPAVAHTICDGDYYEWHGQRLNVAGIYHDTVRNVLGCDSLRYTLNLNVDTVAEKDRHHEEKHVITGDSLEWMGTRYLLDEDSTLTLIYKNIHGCDSAVFTCHVIIEPHAEPATCIVTVLVDDELGGTVTGGGTYTVGEVATVTAIPNEGYVFAKWSNDTTANPYTFTITKDKDITLIAYFQKKQAEEVTVTEPEAVPTDNSVVITWPVIDNAVVYTIEIRKGDELICTLSFNAMGQLVGIAFAPARDGHGAQPAMATKTATGWQYTINGLEPDTRYTYTVTAKKEDDSVAYENTVSFTTDKAMAIDEIINDQSQITNKVIMNGRLYIIRDGKTYDAQGKQIK